MIGKQKLFQILNRPVRKGYGTNFSVLPMKNNRWLLSETQVFELDADEFGNPGGSIVKQNQHGAVTQTKR
jgi:hypothetical protein